MKPTQEELKDDIASMTAIISILIKEIHLLRKVTLENILNTQILASMKGDIKELGLMRIFLNF